MILYKKLSIAIVAWLLCLPVSVCAQKVTPFNTNPLVHPNDSVNYGSYIIYKIEEGIYKINDPGTIVGSGGAWGVDMYLVCGTQKALLIDIGNNYIDGHASNNIPARPNAGEELLTIINGLKGNIPLEIAITHSHGDHTGMAGAFTGENMIYWKSNKENVRLRPKKVEPEGARRRISEEKVKYTLFEPGEKVFDLGGGRLVETFMLQGHTGDGIVYILKKEGIIFSGDTMGSGFGLAFESLQEFMQFVDGTKRLVEYIHANFTPRERFALRIYSGHTWQNNYIGHVGLHSQNVEIGYLDWRFIQDMAACAQAIIDGKWLIEGSGLIHVGNMPYLPFWGERAVGRAIMVYGIGCVVMPIEIAYQAAELKMVLSATTQEQMPQTEIRNEQIKTHLYLPDFTSGYYRGTRFDHSGIISRLECNGHIYFGQWFKEYNPTTHDAVTGPAEEFGAIGYDEAKPGESFVKIGVGALTKKTTDAYDRYDLFDVADPGEWTITQKANEITFTHALSSGNYAYEYQKNIRLIPGKPVMEISHTLKNKGKSTIDTNVYDHNFIMIDNKPIDESFHVTFPFQVNVDTGKSADKLEATGNTLQIKRKLVDNETIRIKSVGGFSNKPSDYAIRIENVAAKAGVNITGDKPLSNIVFWASTHVLSPEPYIDIQVKPEGEFTWKYTYEFN